VLLSSLATARAATLLPPKVPLEELDEAVLPVLHAFEESGLLLVDGARDFEAARVEALARLEECVDVEADHVRTASLADGVLRHTIATKGEFSEEVKRACPEFARAAGELRRLSLAATRRVARALQRGLDESLPRAPSRDGGIGVEESVESGEHLEHFHVYRRDSPPGARVEGGGTSGPVPTLDMHTDLGVLLTMAPALYMKPSGGRGKQQVVARGSGLFVETRDGEVKEVAIPSDGILFMLGEGVNMWVEHSAAFHIPKHAMVMPDENEGPMTRAWYGRMVLPPHGAKLQVQDAGVTYGDFKEVAKRKLQGIQEEGDSKLLDAMQGVSCSHGRTLLTSLSVPGHQDKDECGEGEIYCWMQCMPTKSLNCSTEDIRCANEDGKIWKKETAEMCPSCQLRCESPPTPEYKVCNPNFTPVSMYMSGFTWGFNPNDPCLVYLFQGLVLDNQWKFVLACFVTVGLGVMADCCILLRQWVRENIKSCGKGFKLVLWETVGVAFFTSQAFLSYALMLVAMTYKGELLCSLLAGLAIGYFFFKREARQESPELCCNITLSSKSAQELEAPKQKKEAEQLLSKDHMDSSLRCCQEEQTTD